VLEKYNVPGEIIKPKNYLIATVKPSQKSTKKISPSTLPEVKVMDSKSPNIKNLSIAINFIHKKLKSIRLKNQITYKSFKNNPVKVTSHQITDKINKNLLPEKIDLLVKRLLILKERYKASFLKIKKTKNLPLRVFFFRDLLLLK
jgi:hypothetical protein